MKNEDTTMPGSRNPVAQVVIGLSVLAIGVAVLMTNMGLVELPSIGLYWPVLLILFGLGKMLAARAVNERVSYGFLILIGLALQLNRLGYDVFHFRTLWPLVLMVVGGAVLYQALSGRRRIETVKQVAPASSDAVLDVTAIMAGMERSVSSPDFRGGEISAIMGGCELDLRAATIDQEAVINVFVAMGSIELRIPPDWRVEINGTPILGAFEDKTITPKAGAKRLVIQGTVIMGAVEVRN